MIRTAAAAIDGQAALDEAPRLDWIPPDWKETQAMAIDYLPYYLYN